MFDLAKKILENDLISMTTVTLILVKHETSCVEKLIFLAFLAYEECQIRGCKRHVHQFEAKMVVDFKLDSKSNFTIPNWIRSPP
jgi:hypothetical protein